MNVLQGRIFSKVAPDPNSGCWLWTGATFNHGRPQLRLKNGLVLAARVSYEAFKGEAPGDLMVCHKCDTPLCVNPNHLFLGTHADNMADRSAKGRQARNHGNKNGCAILTEFQVMEIRRTYAKGGVGSEALGREYGVSGRQIRYIVSGKEWAHLPMKAVA